LQNFVIYLLTLGKRVKYFNANGAPTISFVSELQTPPPFSVQNSSARKTFLSTITVKPLP